MLETVLDAKLKPLQQEMTDMKQDITGIKQELTDMKQDITGIKQEMTGMKQDITGIKQEMTGMKQDMVDMKQDISGLHNKLDLLASEQPDDTLALLQIINTKLDIIQKDVEFTFLKTSKNELEINRLKTQ
ncbi:hypothetical protein ACE3NQ_08040 [Paenibacillus terreus]|uniref:Uncharacterized protein n=1 Tax=Paenibacillus terreus TaxID=1387834 RepID=A0ABV5B589_9BACL